MAVLLLSVAVVAGASAFAPVAVAGPHDALITKHAANHGVPESLVRRVIHIESKGNPRIISKGNYGLMQIRVGTARSMGYSGKPEGLLDADTNMTYAVKYLASAYRAAGCNESRAISYYQHGFYKKARAKCSVPQRAPTQVADATAAAQPSSRSGQQAAGGTTDASAEKKTADVLKPKVVRIEAISKLVSAPPHEAVKFEPARVAPQPVAAAEPKLAPVVAAAPVPIFAPQPAQPAQTAARVESKPAPTPAAVSAPPAPPQQAVAKVETKPAPTPVAAAPQQAQPPVAARIEPKTLAAALAPPSQSLLQRLEPSPQAGPPVVASQEPSVLLLPMPRPRPMALAKLASRLSERAPAAKAVAEQAKVTPEPAPAERMARLDPEAVPLPLAKPEIDPVSKPEVKHARHTTRHYAHGSRKKAETPALVAFLQKITTPEKTSHRRRSKSSARSASQSQAQNY